MPNTNLKRTRFTIMKRSFLCAILFGLFLSSCKTAVQSATPQLAESMKGYELYSWQEDGHWNFSLLTGTNREKTLDEIKAADAVLPNLDALEAALQKISAGQFVTWSTKDTLAFPPDDVIQQVEQICADQGLILNTAK